MINRVSSHFLFCEPDRILRQSVIERDGNQTVKAIFSLNDKNVETAQTSFFNGVISAEIVSLKLNTIEEQLIGIGNEYNYVDLSLKNPVIDFTINKQLLIDFGTEDTDEINRILRKAGELFASFSVFDFIAASVYYPALLVNRNAVIELYKSAELILWEQVDLVLKQLKAETRIREI
ncbi:MAG: hypothetical protein WCK78_13905 [Paludibacter sp.]